MTCQQLDSFLGAFVAGELPQAARKSFLEHLDECPECRAYLLQYQKTIELGRGAFDAPVPEPLSETLVRAIVRASRPADETSR